MFQNKIVVVLSPSLQSTKQNQERLSQLIPHFDYNVYKFKKQSEKKPEVKKSTLIQDTFNIS